MGRTSGSPPCDKALENPITTYMPTLCGSQGPDKKLWAQTRLGCTSGSRLSPHTLPQSVFWVRPRVVSHRVYCMQRLLPHMCSAVLTPCGSQGVDKKLWAYYKGPDTAGLYQRLTSSSPHTDLLACTSGIPGTSCPLGGRRGRQEGEREGERERAEVPGRESARSR